MSDAKSSDVSSGATAASYMAKILDAHAKMETQCGEIYVQFAATFAKHPELRRMWALMALEEGGHAAVVRAVNRGLLSGVLEVKSLLLPLRIPRLPRRAVERISATGRGRGSLRCGIADHVGAGMF